MSVATNEEATSDLNDRLERALPRAEHQWFRWASLGIAAVAVLTRFWALGAVPGPLADEVLAAASLHSLFHTGGGFLGIVTPLIDGRAIVAAIGGRSVADLRAVAAVFGLGTIALLMVGTRRLFGEVTAVSVGAVMALMPWSVYYSRIFFPASEYVCASAAVVLTAVASIETRRFRWVVLCGIAGALSIYVYPTAIVTTPILLLTVGVAYRSSLRKSVFAAAGIGATSLLLLVPYLVAQMLVPNSAAAKINGVIGSRLLFTSELSAPAMMSHAAEAWYSYFTFGFVVAHGDPNPVQSIQTMGEVGPLIGIVAAVGIVVSIARIRQPAYQLVLLSLILFPIGDALTLQNAIGNSDVAAIGMLPWSVLAGIGAEALIGLTQRTAWRGRRRENPPYGMGEIDTRDMPRRRVNTALTASIAIGLGLLLAAQSVGFFQGYFGSYVDEYAYRFEFGFAPVVATLEHPTSRFRGVGGLPVSVLAGYERPQMLEYYSNYKLKVVQVLQGCALPPKTFVRYAVAKQVIVVREGWDYGSTPGCVDQTMLIQQTLDELRRAGRTVIVINMFDNNARQSSGPRYQTAVLLLNR